MRLLLTLFLALLPLTAFAAPVVDASAAEAAFMKNDFKTARPSFDSAMEQYLARAPRENPSHQVYREAEYLLDRLADCSFTQRDWPRLKRYMDSQWRFVNQDIAVCDQQLRATTARPDAPRATAQFVADQYDEALRMRQIFQLKRSLALLLVDSNGTGPQATRAIKLYQQLALAMRKVLSVDAGAYKLDLRKLSEQVLPEFEAVNSALPEAEMKALWDKYKPAPSPTPPAPGAKQTPKQNPKPKP